MMRSPAFILIALLIAFGRQGQSQQAVLVAHVGERLEVLDNSAKTVRVLPFRFSGYNAFSMDRQALAAVAVHSKCDQNGAGDLYLLEGNRAARILKWPTHFLLGPFGNKEIEVYADPAMSPSGNTIAFVARPCNLERQLDLVESAGVLVLFDRVKGRSRVLPGTKTAEGVAIGFANHPAWSPDEKRLYVNFETGFRVLRAANGTLVSEYPDTANADKWSNAVGWIGDSCIAFVQGKDFRDADHGPVLALNIDTGETKRLDAILGEANDQIAGIVSLQWPYVLARRDKQLTLLTIGPDRSSARELKGVEEALLIATGVRAEVPRFCRP